MKSMDLPTSSLSMLARVLSKWFHSLQRPAGLRLDDLRPRFQQRFVGLIDRVREGDCRRISGGIPADIRRNAVELVKAVRGRQTFGCTSKVPFPEHRRGITHTLEQLAHGEGVGGKCIGGTLQGDQGQTVAYRVLPGHERRTRRGASWLHQELRETQSL